MSKPKKINLYKEAKGLANEYLLKYETRDRLEVVRQSMRKGSPVRVIMPALVHNRLLKGDHWIAQKWLQDCVDEVSQ